MPSWGPFLPLDDAPDPEFAMDHAGQGFITKELMIGVTSTESYNDFNADDIQASILFDDIFSFAQSILYTHNVMRVTAEGTTVSRLSVCQHQTA